MTMSQTLIIITEHVHHNTSESFGHQTNLLMLAVNKFHIYATIFYYVRSHYVYCVYIWNAHAHVMKRLSIMQLSVYAVLKG